jgi:uncharacterized integral membrane protein
LSGAPRSAGRLIRKIVAVIVLVPLAILIVAFAVANRQYVTISFDPFNPAAPAASQTLPLYLLIIGLLVVGVLIGGIAVWLNHGRWRRAARRFEREVAALRGELAALRRSAGGSAPAAPEAAKLPDRLQLRAPTAG